ncbi:MAG TPA: hypothetical protein VMU78_00170 [Methylocella sp.]|nr:hypothetical protein [Methylocella sp.]
MAKTKTLIERKAYSRRGDIYRWLRDHFQQVFHDIEELQRPWAVIAAEAAVAGVIGTRGAKPTADSVRRVWKRVCRDVQVARDRKVAEQIEREAQAAALEAARRDALRTAHLREQLRPRIVGAPVSSGGEPGTALVPVDGQRRLTEEEEERILAERTPDGRRTPEAVALMQERVLRSLAEENKKRV